MNIKVTGKNIEITGAIREYIEKRLEKLERFASPNTEINVVCSVEREEQIIEIQISTGKEFLRVEERNPDLYASVDLALDKAERQLRKEKEKRIEKNQGGAPRVEMTESLTPDVRELDNDITNTVYYDIKPMTIEDAKMKLGASEDLFLPFVNADTSEVNVIYKRSIGSYGIVIPE